MYEYNPDLDEWRPTGWFNGYPLNKHARQVPVVIGELGVIARQTQEGVYLMKHASVFVDAPPETVHDEPVVVEPEPEPESVVPVDPAPGATNNLLVDQAATMQPGEWRNISHLTTWPGKADGVKFKKFQYVDSLSGGLCGADGMGWTENMVYHNGKLLLMLMRSDGNQRALIGMESDGRWWRINQPEGFDPGGRRPFNRRTQDDEYLYFAPREDVRVAMGYFIRTPLDNPRVFERYGIPINDDQMDSVGNFAITYVPKCGQFYAYTPGGKVFTRTHGEESWTYLGRTAASGCAGMLVWNPVKQELIAAGGQHFGDGAVNGHHLGRITERMGEVEQLPDMLRPDGELLP